MSSSFRQAFGFTGAYLKKSFIEWTVYLVTFIGTGIALYNNPWEWIEALGPILGVLAYIAATFGLMIIAFFLLAWIFFAAINWREKKKKQAKYAGPGVVIETHPRPNERYASLKIHNNTGEAVEVAVLMSDLYYVYTPTQILAAKDTVNPGNLRFSWDKGSESEYKAIIKDDYGVLNVAFNSGNEMVFTLYGDNARFMLTPYYLWAQAVDRNGNVLGEFLGCVRPTESMGFPYALLRGALHIDECDDAKDFYADLDPQ